MIGEKLISRKESTATIEEDVSLVYLRLCDVSVAEGELNEALHHAQRSLAMRQALVLQDPNNAAYLRDLAMSIEKTGEVLTQQGELNEATRSFQDCLET